MKIICPGCSFGQIIEKEDLPPEMATATCPQCGREFALDSFPGRESSSFSFGPYSEITDMSTQGQPGYDSTQDQSIPLNHPAGKTSVKSPPPPFEDRENYDFFAGLFKTIGRVFASPHDFFKGVGEYEENGLMRPYIFSLTLVSIPFALMGLSFLPFGILLGFFPDGSGLFALPIILFVFFLVLISFPFTLALGLFVWAGIIHLMLILFQGANRSIATTFRCYCYSLTIMLLGFIPLVGSITGIVQMVYLIIGLAKAHDISYGKATAAVLTPLAVMLFFSFLVFVFILLLGLGVLATAAG